MAQHSSTTQASTADREADRVTLEWGFMVWGFLYAGAVLLPTIAMRRKLPQLFFGSPLLQFALDSEWFHWDWTKETLEIYFIGCYPAMHIRLISVSSWHGHLWLGASPIVEAARSLLPV